jgi:hypothetical protein
MQNKTLSYRTQKKGDAWTDEAGMAIPFNRISKSEKVKEATSSSLIKDALGIQSMLFSFKTKIEKAMDDVVNSLIEEKKLPKNSKGNHTFYNFDKSIKIEVDAKDNLRFDEALIAAARQQLDAFISDNVQGTDDIIRQLINSAFQNTKGGLDSKKVMSLFKYKTKIKDNRFIKALELIEQSISRPSSKKYFRVWAKDADGQYQNIDLNFSSL